MALIILQSESSSIKDCLRELAENAEKQFRMYKGTIRQAKIKLSFGAFMNVTMTVSIDQTKHAKKGIIATYSTGRNKQEALRKLQESINSQINNHVNIVDFEIGTYVTPVTRRTYAVGIVVYNIPIHKIELSQLGIKERRMILARALGLFNYNPKVLNISEVARTFGVSRDSIYYDIEQILKERKSAGG